MERDPGGQEWLPKLLAATPNAAALPAEILADPGTLVASASRPRQDGPLGCFEYPAPPSAGFLRWLIEHPDRLNQTGHPLFSPATEERRRRLFGDDEVGRRSAIAEALAALEERGAIGSRRQWWAFEGFTSVDCCLETDRLVLFVEGKRTEPLSGSTNWFPARNQLIRNLEVVADVAGDRAAAVLLATETPIEVDDEILAASTPHLDPAARARLWSRYLGQVTWRELCERLEVPWGSLPEEVPPARVRR